MKRALVTGGSGALGSAICRTLAQEGIHVIVHANRGSDRARELVAEIINAGHSAEVSAFDVTDRPGVQNVLEQLLKNGPIQIVVNSAGIHDDAPMAGMRDEQWDTVIDVSLQGFFNVTRPLLLPMLGTRWGRIINLSSVAAILGNRGQVNYSAAKSALHGASRSLAVELASRGVTVNVVAPGIIASPMTDSAFPPERIRALVPMQRAGEARDVADLVAFLVSEKAGYISGQVISVNGAMA